ncbi:MAG: sugar phosphate isomerase/epimerase, partial [Planctomycetales bacterium]|nr:sugar phosphate isomerase/epimerase [Planctomycetales bacterium]
MAILRIGIVARSLRQPLRKSLVIAGRLGADGVEIDLRTELPIADLGPSAVRQVRKLLEDNRLALAAVSFPTRRGYAHTEQLDQRLAATRAAIDAASKLGAPTLVIHPGAIPAQDTSSRRVLSESLGTLAQTADHYGVVLGLQADSDNAADLPHVLAGLPEDRVGVCLNPAELIAGGQQPTEVVKLIGPRLRYVYAADAVRDLATRGA